MTWRRRLTTVLVAVAGASVGIASAGELGWQWVSPLPPAVELHRVVWAQGQYVAVGELGVIVTSQDGRHWTLEDSGTSASFADLVWNGHELVAVGGERVLKGTTTVDDLVVLTSRDGHRWEERARLEHRPSWIYDVGCNAGGVCVVVDGSRWAATVAADGSSTVSDDAFESYTYAVASNGWRFVAVGQDTFVSEDGLWWRPGGTPGWEVWKIDPLAFRVIELGWNGSRFVCADARIIATSADGEEWVKERALGNWDLDEYYLITSLGFSPDSIFASGFALGSDDGVNPTYGYSWLLPGIDAEVMLDSPPAFPDEASLRGGLRGLAWGDAGWVGVGLSGDVLLSTDGLTWTCPQGGSCKGPDVQLFSGVAETEGGAVAVGRSFDKLSWGGWSGWTESDDNSLVAERIRDGSWEVRGLSQERLERNGFSAVASDGEQLVAVPTTWNSVWASSDGDDWTQVRNVFPYDSSPRPQPIDIAWGHARYAVASEDGEVAVSADGVSWSTSTQDIGGWVRKIIATDTGFLALGSSATGLVYSTLTVYSSTDAVEWTAFPPGPGGLFLDLTQGSRLVVVGWHEHDGLLLTFSEDEGWVDRTAPRPAEIYWFTSVAWDGAQYVVVGYRRVFGSSSYDYRYEPVTLVSRDAIHWTYFPYLGPAPQAVLFGGVFATSTGFVGVGSNRTLVEATDFGTLLELDPPVGRIPLNQPATLQVGIDEARDEPTTVLLGASSGAIEVPRLVTIPAGATSVGVPIRGTQVEAGVEIRAELSDEIGGGIAVSRLSVEGRGPRRPGGRKAEPAGAAGEAQLSSHGW